MSRWGDAMLCMFVGGLTGIGLLLAIAKPAPQLTERDVLHAFGSSRPAVLHIASTEIERLIEPHQLQCNWSNAVKRVAPQIDAARPLRFVAERRQHGGQPAQHFDQLQRFDVRTWFEHAAFRASARAVNCEENRVFGDPLDLLPFRCTAGGAPPTL